MVYTQGVQRWCIPRVYNGVYTRVCNRGERYTRVCNRGERYTQGVTEGVPRWVYPGCDRGCTMVGIPRV